MLAIGFDPCFIDIIVRAENEDGSLITSLPVPGHHHRIAKIDQIAGGNSVNIAFVLNKLGIPLDLVIPSNDFFDELLLQRNLICKYRIHEVVNKTMALIWKEGEIQFNSVIGNISREHFTKEIYDMWKNSSIQVSVNWGLNHSSASWVACLWLTSCGWSYEDIVRLNENELHAHACNETMLQSPLVIEPGGMQENPQHRKLEEILSTIALSQYGMYPIFLCNEEESKQFEQLTFSSKIIHTSQTIKLIQGNNERLFDVPKLDNIMTYVGAGDAFLAGIVYQLLQENRIDPEFAILVAQRYMINKL